MMLVAGFILCSTIILLPYIDTLVPDRFPMISRIEPDIIFTQLGMNTMHCNQNYAHCSQDTSVLPEDAGGNMRICPSRVPLTVAGYLPMALGSSHNCLSLLFGISAGRLLRS